MNDKTSSAQSGGAAFGDQATGNRTATGGIGGNAYFGDYHESQTTGVASLHQVPPPPRDFTGRAAEINELLAALEHGGVTISGLHGLGGVGKTTLALKLAALLEGRYPDAQFYLDLRGASAQPTPAADALAHVIRAYHPTARLPESIDDLRALYLSVLHGQRALLLMDNARDEHQVEPLIPPPGCLLMVTSRFHFTVPGLKVKNLDALLPEDAIKLLLEIAPRIGDHAAEIARLCGNLPLGLRLAASLLATKRNFKVAEYVRRLRESSERLKLIEASLNLSYELLRTELQANWRALAVFPDSFDQRAAAAIWQLDEEQTLERLGDLLSFSLVEWSEETDRYRLHDLARIFANLRLSQSELDSSQRFFAINYQSVLAAAERLYNAGFDGVTRGLALYDLERVNIETGQAWAIANADADQTAAQLCIEYSDYGANVFSLRRHPHERAQLGEMMLSAARRLQRRDAEGRALRLLGIAYRQLSETRRAIDFYEQSLIVVRETGNRKVEGELYGGLGIAYLNLGEIARAIELYGQRLTIAREVGDRRGEGNALGSLGVAHRKLGETRHAIDLFMERLAITRETGDFRSEGDTLWNIALALDDLGDRAQAITYAESALVIYVQIQHYNVTEVRKQLEMWQNK